MIRIFVIFSLIVLGGCTWVKLTADGAAVRVATQEEVGNCKKIGKTNAKLTAKVAGINRNPNKVAGELQTVARNSAATMNGDTIIARSEIVNGEQSFDVFRCQQ